MQAKWSPYLARKIPQRCGNILLIYLNFDVLLQHEVRPYSLPLCAEMKHPWKSCSLAKRLLRLQDVDVC